MKDKLYLFQIDKERHDKLLRIKKSDGVPMTETVRRALDFYFEWYFKRDMPTDEKEHNDQN